MFDQTMGPVRHAMVLNLTEDTLNDDLFESEGGSCWRWTRRGMWSRAAARIRL